MAMAMPAYGSPSGVATALESAPPLRLLPPSRPDTAQPVGQADRIQLKPARLPSVTYLGQLRDPVLRLRAPLPLETKRRRGVVTVTYAPLMLWGEGQSLADAMEDFGQTLVELYLGLHAAQGRLGAGLAPLWEHAQQIVAPRP
jgi:hypothetical protein